MKKTLVPAALLMAATAQAGEIYKCVDPTTGRVTLSQTACGADAKPIELKGYKANPTAHAAGSAASPLQPENTPKGAPGSAEPAPGQRNPPPPVD